MREAGDRLQQGHHARIAEAERRDALAGFDRWRLETVEPVLGEYALVTDSLDFEKLAIDLVLQLAEVRQIRQALVDGEVVRIATTLISLETFVGGITDLVHGGTELVGGPPVVGIVTHLGYPVYILSILGIWKILGAVVIVAPGLPRLKEWAYAGVFFELTGAAASYVLRGEITSDLAAPLTLAALAMISWALRPEGRVFGTNRSVHMGHHPQQTAAVTSMGSRRCGDDRRRAGGSVAGTSR